MLSLGQRAHGACKQIALGPVGELQALAFVVDAACTVRRPSDPFGGNLYSILSTKSDVRKAHDIVGAPPRPGLFLPARRARLF
jgi:hypothetical protein